MRNDAYATTITACDPLLTISQLSSLTFRTSFNENENEKRETVNK